MEFYVLNHEVGSAQETTFDPVDPVHLGEAPTCPECSLFTGMRPWLPPLRARLRVFGSQLGDLAFGPAGALLISETFLEAWNGSELEGMGDAVPAEISRISPSRHQDNRPEYFSIYPKRFDTAIDFERSTLSYDSDPSCTRCGGAGIDATTRVELDMDSWSGEDIFVPWGFYRTIVTERVIEMARRHELRNVTAIPLHEYVFDPLRKGGRR